MDEVHEVEWWDENTGIALTTGGMLEVVLAVKVSGFDGVEYQSRADSSRRGTSERGVSLQFRWREHGLAG